MSAQGVKDRQFWEKLADKYFQKPVSNEDIYEGKLTRTRRYLEPSHSVFEFGCGTGTTALKHAEHVKHILATDVADNMLEYGRQQAEEVGIQNVEFLRTSIEDYVHEGERFDVVLGLNILHLCRDPRVVMEKVHALLKPGGIFIQSTACLGDMNPLIRLALPVMTLIGKAPYVHVMTADELYRHVDACGFHIVDDWYPDGGAARFIFSRRAMD